MAINSYKICLIILDFCIARNELLEISTSLIYDALRSELKKITFDMQCLALLPYLSLCRALNDSMKKRKEKTTSKLTATIGGI